ncbi:hypothetical protein TRIATDRAFT_297374 [Trichoderma atroviride IMI 206040]|uniref:Uncharacterized protein n=1 Tax=Hypocrea atroviridis (strain ATCC 20476 / IMI 206040) TaxID=452589 RepID=G9NHC8_HYPAI|nr:uncharacterized protein TRIATDRAFT_297374 [Trichoderma atroviride IMI 206040]EHK50022.1 hypothetical protein TRIATDRAFT_297374 [Trichoderma atroviride IMI 206040]
MLVQLVLVLLLLLLHGFGEILSGCCWQGMDDDSMIIPPVEQAWQSVQVPYWREMPPWNLPA